MAPLLVLLGLACSAWTALEVLRLARGGAPRPNAHDPRTGRRLTLRPERRRDARGRRASDRRPGKRAAG